jgi:nucleoside phosphorylase
MARGAMRVAAPVSGTTRSAMRYCIRSQPCRTEASILPIPDMCTVLPTRPDHRAALVLYMEKYALFGAWEQSKSPAPQPHRESLSQLIAKGVFEPPSRDINAILKGLSSSRFSTAEKQALSVKLGFCLMDFFDAEVDSNRIYFLDSTRKGSPPYLAFKSRLPVTPNPYNFRMGHPHPVLLSFAKLLLEIYCGQSIDLDITSDDRQIRDVWTQLLDIVETLERERQDSQLQAIRGCLLVHQDIAKALGNRDIDVKEAEKKIRRKLYKEVVSKLQQGLAESTPREKRRRSESPSPSPSERFDNHKATAPSRTSRWSDAPEFDLPQRKRQRPDFMSNFPEETEHSSHTMSGGSISAYVKMTPPKSRDEFEVAIVCALPVEYNAVTLLVDEFWDDQSSATSARGDPNRYRTGRIGRINVVLVLLSNMGKASAASSATSLAMSYLGLKLVLLTGICGGVPRTSSGQEILLGDVVISNSVIQYDLGRRFPDQFAMKDSLLDALGRPNKNIRNLVAILGTDLERRSIEKRTAAFLADLQERSTAHAYTYPGAEADRLVKANIRHKHLLPSSTDECLCKNPENSCEESRGMSCLTLGCLEDEHLVQRKRLRTKQLMERAGRPEDAQAPSIFVGPFGSGDTVLKSAEDRDAMAEKYGILAFEMEGAGVWDLQVPCIVVKGVCDYADSHKNKAWQAFASAAASSVTRALLERYIQESPIGT